MLLIGCSVARECGLDRKVVFRADCSCACAQTALFYPNRFAALFKGYPQCACINLCLAALENQPTYSRKIEFRFLNWNLMVPTVQLFIFNFDTFPMIEGIMLGNSIQDSAAAPSFFYLMMAAAHFRQATCARHPHMRHALREMGREYLTNADRWSRRTRVRAGGLHPLTSNTES